MTTWLRPQTRQQALADEVRAQMASNSAARQAAERSQEQARAYSRVAPAGAPELSDLGLLEGITRPRAG